MNLSVSRQALFSLAVCAAFTAFLPSSWAEELRAGTAKVDITPTAPVTMAGYESRKDVSQGVHDPLFLRVLAFEEGGRRLVLVSMDVLGFYNRTADALREQVRRDCQLEPSELMLAAIHTHSAPTLIFDPERGHSNNVAYFRELQGKLSSAVRAALQDLRPVEISFATGACPVGANRRQWTTNEQGQTNVILGRNPAATIDREVQVLQVSGARETNLYATLFAYPTHSTSLGPRNYLISGDIHGLAEQFVEGQLGGGVTAPGFAGASGDIDPWFRVQPGFRQSRGWVPEPVLLGTLLGEEILHVLEAPPGPRRGGQVRTAFRTLMLPGQAKPNEGAPADVPLALSVGRVGDVAFVGIGGELFNEIGRAIKKTSPFPVTIVITHCNGAAGYLPTRESYAEGGYEVKSSPFGPGAAEQIPGAVREMLEQIR
jgi:hypothetical protein